MNVRRGCGSGRAETMVNAERLRLDEPDSGGDRHVVVVNLSGRRWQLTEILGQNVFERDGGELASPGLFVDLEPWQFHLLALQ
jgi:hypothetical protein